MSTENYYGQQWLQIAESLEIGQFIMKSNKLDLISVPLFQRKHRPKPYQTVNGNLLQRLDQKLANWIRRLNGKTDIIR